MNELQIVSVWKEKGFQVIAAFAILLAATLVMSTAQAQEQKLKQTQGSQMQVDKEAKASQERVSKTATETKTLVDEYRATLRKIENTKVYNEQLRKLIKSQKTEMVSIRQQITDIKETNKGIVPLMIRMIANVKEFIKLDVPFLMEERNRRMAQLDKVMNNAKVSTSEKFRRVLEAYQIENDYGRNIEAYRGIQQVDGKELTVDFLRVGRIALLYQTLDGKRQGMWNQSEKKWEPLSSSYRKPIQQGIRMARKQLAPNLMRLPIAAPTQVEVSMEGTSPVPTPEATPETTPEEKKEEVESESV